MLSVCELCPNCCSLQPPGKHCISLLLETITRHLCHGGVGAGGRGGHREEGGGGRDFSSKMMGRTFGGLSLPACSGKPLQALLKALNICAAMYLEHTALAGSVL